MKKLFSCSLASILIILLCGITSAQVFDASLGASIPDVSLGASIPTSNPDINIYLPSNTGTGGTEDRPIKLISAVVRPGVKGITTPIVEFVPEMAFPDPARPGRDLSIRLRVYNSGGVYSQNVSVEIIPNEVFYLKSHDLRTKRIRLLCPLCSVQLNYYLTVEPNTKTGIYPLRFKVTSDKMISEYEMMINIVSVPYLIIANLSTNPEKIVPGTSFILNMSVKNVETGNARNVVAALLINQQQSILTGKNIPVMPSKGNSIYIPKIKAGETRQIELPLYVDGKADPGMSQLPVQLAAFDESGVFNFSSMQIIGVNILGNAILTPASITTDPTIVRRKENFILISRIENSGRGDAKEVVVDMNLPFKGVKKVFLGKVDADGDMPAVFNMKASSSGTKRYNITIHYKDDVGEHIIIYPLELYVAFKLSFIETLILIILAIDLLIYIIYEEKSVVYTLLKKVKQRMSVPAEKGSEEGSVLGQKTAKGKKKG